MKLQAQVLDKEQIRHLQDLGFPTDEYSSLWINSSGKVSIAKKEGDSVHTMSVADIICVLPPTFVTSRTDDGQWVCGNPHSTNLWKMNNLIDLLYKVLCWSIENNKISIE